MVAELQRDLPMDKIVDFCKRWKIREFAVFGSILSEDFRPDSDVDVLVTFDDDIEWGFEYAQMQDELAEILDRSVDLGTKRGVSHSRNVRRREEILSTARTIYAA